MLETSNKESYEIIQPMVGMHALNKTYVKCNSANILYKTSTVSIDTDKYCKHYQYIELSANADSALLV